MERDRRGWHGRERVEGERREGSEGGRKEKK